MRKVIVIGLDGANWELLEPWIEDGTLANLAYLRENGSWGKHQSCLPPVTFPNWKCYSTGKNPGKLGVYWWERICPEKRKVIIPDSRDFKSKDIWDYMGENGLKVGIINMPGIYPPKEVNGFMVSGGPDSSSKHYAYPAWLEEKLVKEFNYRVHPQNKLISKEHIKKNLGEILRLLDSRFKVAKEMLSWGLDFLHLTIFYINALQHYFYTEEPVKEAWKVIDKNLSEFIRPDYNLILLSDHGCKKTNIVFYVNSWLEKQGYLKIRGEFLKFSKFNKDRTIDLVQRFKLLPLVKFVPERIKKRLPDTDGTIKRKGKEWIIDWDKSLVIGSGQGLLYLNIKQDDPQYEKLRGEIIEKLETLSFNGKKITKRVYRREEIYKGPYVNLAPDIVFEQMPGIHTSGGIGKDVIFESPPSKWEAENIKEGIFLGYSPKTIKRGFQVHNVKIIDIAPTILYLMKLPIPSDIDGRVLEEIFKEKPIFKRNVRPPKEGEGKDGRKKGEEEEIVRERLKELGYLD